jgi:hypothetical protein
VKLKLDRWSVLAIQEERVPKWVKARRSLDPMEAHRAWVSTKPEAELTEYVRPGYEWI